jgi:hypothetical protein
LGRAQSCTTDLPTRAKNPKFAPTVTSSRARRDSPPRFLDSCSSMFIRGSIFSRFLTLTPPNLPHLPYNPKELRPLRKNWLCSANSGTSPSCAPGAAGLVFPLRPNRPVSGNEIPGSPPHLSLYSQSKASHFYRRTSVFIAAGTISSHLLTLSGEFPASCTILHNAKITRLSAPPRKSNFMGYARPLPNTGELPAVQIGGAGMGADFTAGMQISLTRKRRSTCLGNFMNWEQMKPLMTRIADFWCKSMHTEMTWPAHGQYQCLTCGRLYRVCWEEVSLAPPRVRVLPVGTWPLDCSRLIELAK